MTNEELALRIAAGEEDLIIDLWEQVEKFVNWQANRFFFGYQDRCKQLSIELDDLHQEGYFAMMNAIEKFDPARGTKFLTAFGYYLKKRFFRMAKMDYTGWKHNKVYASDSLDALNQNCAEQCASLCKSTCLLDSIAAEDDELEKVEAEVYWAVAIPAINKALDALTERQREILTSVYYEGYTREATAERFGISKGGVNTILRGGMKKLRDNTDLYAACAC